MKRAGFLIALVVLALLVADAASAGNVRSKRRTADQEEDRNTITRHGNTGRTVTPGNVRRSGPRRSATPSHRATDTPRTVTRRVGGSTSRPVAGSTSRPVAGSTSRTVAGRSPSHVGNVRRVTTTGSHRRESSSRTDRPARNVRRSGPRRSATPSHRVTETPRIVTHRVGGSTSRPVAGSTSRPVAGSTSRTVTGKSPSHVSNLRRVTTTGSRPHGDDSPARSRMLRPHRRHPERRDCDRPRRTFEYASRRAFLHRRDRDRFLYVHSGPRGPYWFDGRWHPYRRGCSRVLYYGYWIDTRDYYYIHRLRPPWAEHDDTVCVVHDEAPRVVREYEYDTEVVDGSLTTADFIPKGQIQDAVITKALELSAAEWRRVDVLIARGMLRELLEQGDTEHEFGYDYDKLQGLLTLTAPSERVAVIETIVRDERTFEAMTESSRYGLTAAVIPVVSPFYLEGDFRGAVRVATDNTDALRRMLEGLDSHYAEHDKACWFNAQFGTATIIDKEQSIQRAATLMEARPFVPNDLVD